jgi:hypothetical protein
MRLVSVTVLSSAILLSGSTPVVLSHAASDAGDASSTQSIFGFRDTATESAIESRFLAAPDPKLAEQHLRTLTRAPHMAGTPEDKATADYVAQKFREAGLDTEIVEYKVWINYPSEISLDLTAPAGVEMHGPTPEHVDGDPYDDDPRVVMPFNGMSPSGDVEADVVYANYGTPEDFEKSFSSATAKTFGGSRSSSRRSTVRPGSSSTPIRLMMAGAAATSIPMAHGVQIRACSAGQSVTCSSFPVIRPRPALPLSHRCPIRNAFLRRSRRKCRRFP